MDRDYLYFHFANLGLIIIGLLSVQKIVGIGVMAFLVVGSAAGFMFSLSIRKARPPHIDTFIGMLSLASVVIILSRLYETAISFDNLMRIFSTALAWLSLFQAFGLSEQKNYNIIQFISVCLLIASVSLAVEQETVYVLYLAAFLFILIFAMRLDLVCKKENQGSVMIGDRDEVMSLWHQIKVGAIMFSIILMLSALVYPMVPRFNSLSLRWIPASLLGLPEKIPLLKLLESSDKKIKDAKMKKEQLADDRSKKRETKGDELKIKKKADITERFKASDFDKNIDAFKIESLTIKADKKEINLDRQIILAAELKLTDGTVIPAVKLVDWKVTGDAKVSIDKDGKLIPKGEGSVRISASYLGAFSNDLNLRIIEPVRPKKKKGFLSYLLMPLLWILAASIAVFCFRALISSRRLNDMRKADPKEFIKEIYYALRRGFKLYGIPKLDYIAYREFYDFVKDLISDRPGPMQALTEGFLEARFSSHEISGEHSRKAIELFHEVKDVILKREDRDRLWKGLLFRLYVLDVLLVPRQ